MRTIPDAVRLIVAGDPLAVNLARRAGRFIGKTLSEVVSLLNPSIVVIGGELAAGTDYVIAGIRESVYAPLVPLATRKHPDRASHAWGTEPEQSDSPARSPTTSLIHAGLTHRLANRWISVRSRALSADCAPNPTFSAPATTAPSKPGSGPAARVTVIGDGGRQTASVPSRSCQWVDTVTARRPRIRAATDEWLEASGQFEPWRASKLTSERISATQRTARSC